MILWVCGQRGLGKCRAYSPEDNGATRHNVSFRRVIEWMSAHANNRNLAEKQWQPIMTHGKFDLNYFKVIDIKVHVIMTSTRRTNICHDGPTSMLGYFIGYNNTKFSNITIESDLFLVLELSSMLTVTICTIWKHMYVIVYYNAV